MTSKVLLPEIEVGIATVSAQYTSKLTSVFLKMSPGSSWNSQGSLYRRSDRLRAAYDTLMAARVVARIVS